MKDRDKLFLNYTAKASFALVLLLLFLSLPSSAGAATAPLLYAYNKDTNRLISFRADSPSVLRSSVTITGLNSGEMLLSMDFRPANGQLYATGGYTSSGTFFYRVLLVNPWNGVATQVGNPQQFTTTTSELTFDVSPTADLIRQTNNLNKNYRMSPVTGSLLALDTDLAYVAGDPSAGFPANLVDTAYSNNVVGATSTTLYGIDFLTDKLVRIGGVSGSPSPNGGEVTTIGSLGVVNDQNLGGFDIQSGTNDAYAALRVAPLSRLYRINLTTGAATLIGSIGNGTDRIDGLAIAPQNTPFDFDGDNKADLSIFRPGSGQWWYSRSLDSASRTFQFGTSSDILAPADYTGDGKTDIAYWRASNGNWYILRSEDSTFYAFPFGAAGDVPVPGDYDGDRRIDAAVYRPSTNVWYQNRSIEGTFIFTFGSAGDKPVVSDYDGDGRADIAIFRPNGSSGAEWWVRRSASGQTSALQFGISTDKPVQADYTGDGKADIAFFRPSNGGWYILRSDDFSFYSFPFGTSTDLPVAADYDGDGKTDPAVYRPSTSTWYANRSGGGTSIQTFGVAGDVPVAGSYIP